MISFPGANRKNTVPRWNHRYPVNLSVVLKSRPPHCSRRAKWNYRMSVFGGLSVQTEGINTGNVSADRKFLWMSHIAVACSLRFSWRTDEELLFHQSFFTYINLRLQVILLQEFLLFFYTVEKDVNSFRSQNINGFIWMQKVYTSNRWSCVHYTWFQPVTQSTNSLTW